MNGRGGEAGSASLALLALAVVAVVVTLLVADTAVLLAGRARAQVAADAAALAAAPVTFRPFGARGGPADEAATYAHANGASLEECRCTRDTSWRARTVVVRVSIPLGLWLLPVSQVGAWSSADFIPIRLHR